MLMIIAIVIAQVFVCCAIVLGVLEFNIENDDVDDLHIVDWLIKQEIDEILVQVKLVLVFELDEQQMQIDEYDIIVDDDDELVR